MGVKSRVGSVSSRQSAIENLLRDRLPARLVAEREALGLTQEAVAEKAGVHWTTVGKVERGVQIPSVALLVLIAEALQIDVGVLLGTVLEEQSEPDACLQLLQELPAQDRRSLTPVLEALVAWKKA